ncbi:MAG: HlyD family secretion protein [Limisphaerales bacterium]
MNPNSEMERLEPIPSPPGALGREIRHRFVPVVVFAAATVVIALLWQRDFRGQHFFGEVEARRANVITVEGGTLTGLAVDRFSEVKAGEVIGTVEFSSTEAAGKELDVAAAELRITRARMALDEARNAQGLEDLRSRWLEARVDLAGARVNLERARLDHERNSRLHAEKVIADAEFELTRAVHESLLAEVAERERLAAGLAAALPRFEAMNSTGQAEALKILDEAVAAQEGLLDQARIAKLRAPIDGVITAVNHQPGERIPPGAIVAVVTAPRSQRIIGYVRQPLAIEPRVGMPVEIRTRTRPPLILQSSISKVGTHLELVSSPLRLRGFDNALERGLPFLVELPPEAGLHPGELVDLILRPGDAAR